MIMEVLRKMEKQMTDTSRFIVVVALVTQASPLLCNPMDPPGSSVHGILQPGVQEWVAISSSIILSMHILFGVLDRRI